MTCKPGKPRKGKVKVTCTVRFVAAASSRTVVGRLVHGKRVYASGRQRVRAGRRGRFQLRARRRLRPGRYTLVLSFIDARGAATVIKQRVTVSS